MKKKGLTAGDLTNLLSVRYSSPAYAFLSQVRNQTGFSRDVRTADGLALSLYPSRGIHLHGFEIKVSRSDWRTELKNPEKADEIGKHCHYWWIVAPSMKEVPLEELPATWGLLVERGGKLYTEKEATLMTPDPLPLTMLAAVFRKVSESMEPADAVSARVQAAIKERQRIETQKVDSRVEECERTEAIYKEFEEKSGLRVSEWNLGNIAEAVRTINSGGTDRRVQELKAISSRVRQLSFDVDKEIAALERISE